MRIELSGCDTATYGEMSVSSVNGALCKLARKIVANGMSGDTVIDVYRNGAKCFNDAPISYWAERSTTEAFGSSVKLVPYVAFSGVTVASQVA